MSDARSRFAALLFTDIVGSTALKAELGVPVYSAALQRHNEMFESLQDRFQGMRIVKNMGDGYFAMFPGIADAVRFALLFQHAMRTEVWEKTPLTTRVGIHAGEVADIESLGQADVVAPAADMAARIMSLALGGQILLTRTPFDEARHFLREHPTVPGGGQLPPLQWLAHGPYRAKGADEALDVFEVGADGLAPLMPPPDSAKVRRAIRAGEEDVLGWRPAIGQEVPERPGWKLVDRLGAGGFGEVWVAEHTKLGERRAFKFCFDDDRLRGLKREVTLTRLLRTALGDRDDIVRFFELKLDEPPFYLESEYAPEGNLLQWAQRQGGLAKVPLETRLEIAAACATALAAAHSVGVLHKDIKPANILIFRDKQGIPRPRLVDFGIGTLSDAEALARHGVTGAGFTMASMQNSSGTPLYSPPEFLAGRPYTVQGDVFGLGVMLYQMVVADPDRPLAPGWERDISDPLLREDIALCVDGDPERRFAGTVELAERLRALPERRAEVARKQAAAEAELARRRRQKTLVFASAAAILVALLTVPLAIWALKEKDQAMAAKGESDAAKAQAMANAQKAQAEEEKARSQVREASRADFATAQARLAEGRWQEGVAYLGRALRYDPENRNAREALWLALVYGERDAGRMPRHSLAHESPVSMAAFSPDGRRVLTACEDGTVRQWEVASGKVIGEPLRHGEGLATAVYSPDGTRILTAGKTGMQVSESETGRSVWSVGVEADDAFTQAAFNPTGSRIVTASVNDQAMIWNALTGTKLNSPMTHSFPLLGATFTPNGGYVVTHATDGVFRYWDIATSESVPKFDAMVQEGTAFAIAPNGKRLAVAYSTGEFSFFDPATGEERKVGGNTGTRRKVTHLVFSPDSSRLLNARAGSARIWDAAEAKVVGERMPFEGEAASIAFSADGSRVLIAASNGSATLWDARTGRTCGPPFTHGSFIKNAVLSADGGHVITWGSGKSVRLWSTACGPVAGIPLAHRAAVSNVSFSTRGGQLFTVDAAGQATHWDAAKARPAVADKSDPVPVARGLATRDGTRHLVRSIIEGKEQSRLAQVSLYDVASGARIGEPMTQSLLTAREALSPDGTRAVIMPLSNAAQLCDPRTGKPIGPEIQFQGESFEFAMFSPDGKQLLTASSMDGVRLHDSADGRLLATTPPTRAPITAAGYSRSGERFLVAQATGTLQFFDAATGLGLGPALQHAGSVLALDFNPDGKWVVTGSADTTARLWEIGAPPPLTPEMAESLTAFACGARLDSRLGTLALLPLSERERLYQLLAEMPGDSPWRFAADRSLPLSPATPISSRHSVTVRDAASLLLAHVGTPGDLSAARVMEAQEMDPAHPLLPLAMSVVEILPEEGATNPERAKWLCTRALERMEYQPKSLPAADLRQAAKLVLKLEDIEKTGAKKSAALMLLNQARSMEAEDAEALELRRRASE